MVERHEEQRDYFRMCIDCPMVFGIDTEGYAHKGIVKNLSASGLFFHTDTNLNIGADIRVSIEPLNNITPPMILNATILRQVDTDGDEDAKGKFGFACSIVIVQ